MARHRIRHRSRIWGAVAVMGVAAGGLGGWWLVNSGPGNAGSATRASHTEGALEALGVYGQVPDFTLTERSGRPVRLAELLGKVWLANFIYTQCTETCPLQSAHVARLQVEFAGERDLRLVSITVDPERDTPAALSAYAAKYGADPIRWLFLTGDKQAIYSLAKEGFRLGVVHSDDQSQSQGRFSVLEPVRAWAAHGSQGLIMHSARLVLVDRQARIRAYHLPDDGPPLDRLRRNLRILLRERARGQ